MTRPVIVGVMGGGSAGPKDLADAHRLGRLIAEKGWILLNGGRNAGIMAASAKGASEAGGVTVGILPDGDAAHAAPHIRIPIITAMGNARNAINVLSSRVVVACPGGAGTLSEIALALKVGKPVVLINFDADLDRPPFSTHRRDGRLCRVDTPEAAIKAIERLLGGALA
jgi:hypothetical protein